MTKEYGMTALAAAARKPYRGAPMEGSLARWYARQTKTLIATFASEARNIAALLPPGARVLELAPGPGYLAVEIAKLAAFEVVGLDISESFVSMASDYAAKSGVKVEFRQGDAASIPFPPESFDFIICRAAFKNFSDPVGAIAEMHRVLRSGGQAVIRDMRGDASDAALDAEVRAMGLGRLATILNRFIFRQLRRRAYTSDDLLRMVAATPFGRAEVRKNDLGFDIVLMKAPTAAERDSPTPSTAVSAPMARARRRE
jgi:ubiquinone/menaquinone biosynthesis C-methylase UbiE